MKDADREDEVLFPLSALTPPPPPGRSDLPATWASALPELRVATTAMVAIPELVSTGELTSQQGATVAEMIRAEDPVVFAACRVAGAAAAGSLPTATVTASVAGTGGAGAGRGLNGGQKGRGTKESPGWNREVRACLASMLGIVLADRERGRVVGNGDDDVHVRMVGGAGSIRDMGRGATAAGGGDGGGEGERVCGSTRRDLLRDDFCGGGDGGDGGGGGGGVVPQWFQSDAIALADVALVTGRVSRIPAGS